MSKVKTELSEVIYNAAEQAFEAMVTLHDASGTQCYPCSIPAPIDMTFERAADGLTTQALRRHSGSAELRSHFVPTRFRRALRAQANPLRRGLPLGQYGFFRGRNRAA